MVCFNHTSGVFRGNRVRSRDGCRHGSEQEEAGAGATMKSLERPSRVSSHIEEERHTVASRSVLVVV